MATLGQERLLGCFALRLRVDQSINREFLRLNGLVVAWYQRSCRPSLLRQRMFRRHRLQVNDSRPFFRATLWNAKPENRHLPSVLERANIRLMTKRKDWTEPQRKMMRRAARTHGWRSALSLAGMAAVAATWIVLWDRVARSKEATRIEGMVGRLVSAEPPQVLAVMDGVPGGRMVSPEVNEESPRPQVTALALFAQMAVFLQ